MNPMENEGEQGVGAPGHTLEVREAPPRYLAAPEAVPAEEEVPAGYKRTEVGVIPEDWVVLRVADSCTKVQDGTHFSPKVSGGDFFYVTSRNIGRGYIDLTSAGRIDASQHADIYRRCDVQCGDVLLTKDGANTGNAALNTLKFEFSLLSSVAFLRLRPEHSAPYLLQQILSRNGKDQIKYAMTGNAITRLTLEKISDLFFPFPSTKIEQQAIAEALSDADALIESLQQLIAKQRAIKQGAMQALLTGRQRLPGFSGEWRIERLGDVAHIKTGSRNNQDKVENGAYPFFVRSENVERINSYSYDCEAILVPGEGKIGEIFHYINGRFDVHQRVYAITQFLPNVSGRYIHLYMSVRFGAHAMENTVKATVDSLRLPTFQDFEIRLPPTLDEQTAIAIVLSDMNAEIDALQARLAKTRAFKAGMMQQLLTGRIRLVPKGQAHA